MGQSLAQNVLPLIPPCRYASEVDVDFVRKSVKAIGQAAIKIEEGAERCVNVLLDLIATRVSYVVQEAVVVMKVLDCDHSDAEDCLIIGIGYLQKIPIAVRRHHSNAVRKSRRTRRTRSQSLPDLDYWGVRKQDRQRRRIVGDLCGYLYGGVLSGV